MRACKGRGSMAKAHVQELYSLQDEKYRQFQIKLIPGIDPETVIGVRTPELRKMAKGMMKNGEAEAFLRELPHGLFEENQLHAFILSEMKDYELCVGEVDRFLPFVDNWATCDQLSPKVFRKNRAELLKRIKGWIRTDETYTIRFGIGMLLAHYLDEDFDPEYLELVAKVRSDEYYVNMMRAWYFATALAKQYEAALPYVEGGRLDKWTHNKTIQKAVESCRVPEEHKEKLRGMRVR